ncbi:MAG TPA: ribokinase [Isosphaeraceae bacterium]|jgi:ribokinase|nr:ribokinase [Isosphaeraceae bacterium]
MPRVVVLGSSGYDLTIRLPRLPRPGETLLGGELLRGPGGKGANQAIAARRAGAEVVFLTAFGDDDFGRLIAGNDRAEGLDLGFARVVGETANQVALIFVGDDGQNAIGVAPGASARLGPEVVDALPEHVFRDGGVFLACLEVPLATVRRGLERARGAGMVTILNPAPADRSVREVDLLRLVDLLTPNQEEAQVLTGLPAGTPDEAARAARALRECGAAGVVLTMGEAGCLVESAEGTALVPAPRVAAVDTVGAGDAFNGALAVALAEGRPLAEAAAFATAAGSWAVTKPGAQGALPTRAEIERLVFERLVFERRMTR